VRAIEQVIVSIWFQRILSEAPRVLDSILGSKIELSQ
jgi:hypothetical protein